MRKKDSDRQSGETRLWSGFLAPVDIASLVYFRIAFGTIMLWEVWRYFHHDWIAAYWIKPTFHFTFWGFGWVKPWPGEGMYLHFYALGLLAILIALGLFYRVSTTVFFLGFTYVFLLEKARYLNHFYLICLISFLLIFIPSHRAFSLDSLRRPRTRSDTAPVWGLWILRAQIGIVYFYGGLAKLDSDWLASAPMREFLAARTDFPLIGPYFTREWMIDAFTYGGLLLDLLVVPLLLWKRTRAFGFLMATAFHLTNAKLFSIGIFPWFMIAATTLYFRPDWPRLLLRQVKNLGSKWLERRGPGKGAPVGRKGPTVARRSFAPATEGISVGQRCTLWLLALYLGLQVLLPLRHVLYPGSASWTEEGHKFSWRMMLRKKQAARVQLKITDPVSKQRFNVRPQDHLANWQEIKMSSHPDMIHQFVQYVAGKLRHQGYPRIQVQVWAEAALQDRELQLLIDPEVDLAAVERSLKPASWIMPMKDRSEVGQPSR